MNPCKFNTYLTAYVLGDMDQKRLDALDAHLKTCPDCQKKAAELRATLSLLKEAFPAEKTQTGNGPVLAPERRQQLLTIKPLSKANLFMRFIDKAYRPLRMIAATLLCVFGILAILSAAMFPAISSSMVKANKTAKAARERDAGFAAIVDEDVRDHPGLVNSVPDSTLHKDENASLSSTVTGTTGGIGGGGGTKTFYAVEPTALERSRPVTEELRKSYKRTDTAIGEKKSKVRAQAGEKLSGTGWADKSLDVSDRSKAKLRERVDYERSNDGDGFEVNQPVPEPVATPEPIAPLPATIDAVTVVKSPVVRRGIYALRSDVGAVTKSERVGSDRLSSPEGTVAAAPVETSAPPPARAIEIQASDRLERDKEVAAPEKPTSSFQYGVGYTKSENGRVSGEEREKDSLRRLEPLKIQAPKPSFTGTPKDIRSANLEKPGERDNKPADYPVVSYKRVAESKVLEDSKFQLKGIAGLVNGETVVTAGALLSGKRDSKHEESRWKEEEVSKKELTLSNSAVISDEATTTSDLKLGINNELKKEKADEILEAADVRKKLAPPRETLPFNSFVVAATEPFSTFAMDVDTASYTLTRQALRSGKLPDPERVRLEEIVNAFDYADTAPDRATFRVYQDGAQSPFGAGCNLLRIGVKGRRLGREEQRPAMLTFVIDVSGSMSQPDRIGYARQSLSLLLDQVGTDDRIQIIAYSDQAQFVLPPSPATEKARIMAAFDRLQCNGSTNLEEGLRRAYEQAAQAFIPGAENRVILISDGVANLGADSAQEILNKVAANRKQGITCSVFGVGTGTYNDKMLQELANKGDGVYRFLDSAEEVKTAFVDDLAATLNFIAKDAKIQVEWNPKTVRRYRQMGYEKRKLTKEQFRDDTVDAGEVGSGQSVTALYELELMPDVTPESSLGTVRIRYQRTDNGKVEEIESALVAATVLRPAHQASVYFKVAASAAEFAELLRGSPYAQDGRLDTVADYLRPAALERSLDTRVKELLELVTTAASLTK